MKDFHYFELRALLYKNEINCSVQFSLEHLAAKWYYSKQNTKRKLKNYAEKELLQYIPGKGRGNLSKLIFHNDFHVEVHQILTDCTKEKDIKFALQLSQLAIPQEWFAPFIEEIQTFFHNNSKNDDNIIRFIINRKITTINPTTTSLHFEATLIKQISDTLVNYSEKENRFTSSVAITWSHSEDFSRWQFILRKNIIFHNEKKLTGKDVIFTFNEAAKSHTGEWLLANLDTIYCETDFIVHFKFKKPEPNFLKLVTHYSLVMRSASSSIDTFIGCGPFMLMENKDNYTFLKSFPKYFKEQPLVEGIEFWLIHTNFRKWLIVPQTNSIPAIDEEVTIETVAVEREGAAYLIFNEKKVAAIDSTLINTFKKIFNVSNFLNDLYKKSTSTASSYFNRLPEAGKSILINDTNHFKVPTYLGRVLILAVYNHPRLIKEAVWFKERAAIYHIPIEVVPYSFEDEFYTKRTLTNADIVLAVDIPVSDVELGYLDFLLNKTYFFQNFVSDAHLAEVKRLIESYLECSTQTRKIKLLEEIENYITQENLLIYLYHPLKHYSIHHFINGVEFDNNGSIILKKLWW
ncbi:hypothetical protein HCJ52_05395 [Listeria sp. FSL L7-1485]|uniref:ABC transporter substrate-binding protein n=1 Tax=Listeria immobilis TaxID=2713502 RepID=A0A7X1C8C4_9LIST|nr:ABC transporter substrate-binding protein [Listeria immobilis]MBC1488146.1 hypothetical protein [Listeria immobilis]MBC1535559.1 hypothetical protein [Listeria immobilis]